MAFWDNPRDMYTYKRIEDSALVAQPVIDVFHKSFSASEGEEEGKLIRSLVKNLLSKTAESDIFIFAALNYSDIIGCAIFSRLTYSDDPRTVFILSPMAIHPDHQNNGVGQNLLQDSIGSLRNHGVDILVTYGDPKFYAKVGFLPVSQRLVPAPFPLSMPIGWIGQSLDSAEITPLQGACSCVSALNNAAIW